VKQGKRPIATAALVALFATGLSPTTAVWAAEAGDVQDLRLEVGRLRAQLQALQGAIAEVTELERQRDVAVIKTLKEPVAPAHAAAPPPPAAPVAASEAASEARGTTTPPTAAAASDDKPRGASRHRRHRRSARSRR
jgi:TolA-binding protein